MPFVTVWLGGLIVIGGAITLLERVADKIRRRYTLVEESVGIDFLVEAAACRFSRREQSLVTMMRHDADRLAGMITAELVDKIQESVLEIVEALATRQGGVGTIPDVADEDGNAVLDRLARHLADV